MAAAAASSADLMMSIDPNLKPPSTHQRPTTIAPPPPPPPPDNNNKNSNITTTTSSSSSPTKLSSPGKASPSVEMLNPFVHKLELVTSAEKIQTAILTVLVLPIRLLFICILLVSAWALACIGLYGVSEEELASKPMSGWRLFLKSVISTLGQWSYNAGGMSIRVKGAQARREDAAILVLAPHSTFLDSVIVYVTNMCSVMVRKESMDNYAGKLINFTQPLYVWRDDPNSRQNTIKKIIERANSKDNWPQIIIFPEGTCTNRSCLITFKPGAFYPGVPVQPVCIRYPNALDTVTWTWEGPGFFKLIWLTLTRVHSCCEIEFLPVYNPSDAEKADPKLYARNVRAVMAKVLSVPVSDYTFNDCKLMSGARARNIPQAAQIVEIDAHRKVLGLQTFTVESALIAKGIGTDRKLLIDLIEFKKRLQIDQTGVVEIQTASKLFAVFDPEESGEMDFRAYLLCAAYLAKRDPSLASEYFALVARMFATKNNTLSEDALSTVLQYTGMPKALEHSEALFSHLSNDQQTVDVAALLNYLETLPLNSNGLPLMSSAANPLKSKPN